MGLRGFFRKNAGDETPNREAVRPAAAPPGPERTAPERRDPEHRDPEHGGAGSGGADGSAADEPRPLPPEGPLAVLVDRLTARGADRAVLTLVQRGNTMTHQTEQSVEEAAPSVESGTVDQDSPLFDPVADLYSEAMSSPRGPWQQARIEVGPEQGGTRPVVTTYGFADGAQDVRTWRSGRPAPAGSAAGTDGGEDVDEQATATGGAASQAPAADGPDPVTAVVPGAEDGDGSAATGTAPVDGAERPGEPAGPPLPEPADERPGEPAGPPTGEPVAVPAPVGTDVQSVPDHVDHEEWHEDVEPAAPTGAAAATAAAVAAGEDHDTSAPETAVSTDVSPSYRAPAGTVDRPSAERLARGNLVLKEADVLRRLAEAQRRLFGEDGTAMDVSTVLVRVRALGTYYDALTHVRKNGFWDQRRTFELIPEELLHVQELKDESYVEGAGSPLAMMFRFRPGIPPEVSFDYADEEAFVRYEQRLPGQNYLEELRMYPRTGANIPQHMNEALQDWNY